MSFPIPSSPQEYEAVKNVLLMMLPQIVTELRAVFTDPALDEVKALAIEANETARRWQIDQAKQNLVDYMAAGFTRGEAVALIIDRQARFRDSMNNLGTKVGNVVS